MELEAAIKELREAEASREAPAAELDALKEQFAEFGRKAAHAGTEPERTAFLREQYLIGNAQTGPAKLVAEADARIRAARLMVGKSA
jgi:hypothetical protein